MEKQFNREDRLIKKLLNEAGTEKPSADFKSKIMMKVEARNVPIKPYAPLISKSVWFALGGVLIAAMIGLYIINSEQAFSFEYNFDYLNSVRIPAIDLSRTMQIAIAFIALFFLEVPFLKRFLDREYRL